MLNIFKLLKVGRKNVYMNNINIRFQVNGRGRQMTGTPRRKLLSPVPPFTTFFDTWLTAGAGQCRASVGQSFRRGLTPRRGEKTSTSTFTSTTFILLCINYEITRRTYENKRQSRFYWPFARARLGEG